MRNNFHIKLFSYRDIRLFGTLNCFVRVAQLNRPIGWRVSPNVCPPICLDNVRKSTAISLALLGRHSNAWMRCNYNERQIVRHIVRKRTLQRRL